MLGTNCNETARPNQNPQELAILTNVLSLQIGVPPGAPLAPTNTQAALTNTTITNLLTQLNGLLSNSVKTV